ncbi:hypothetical protein KCU65_g309, partial [Aureobasidium melanogenum]
LRISITTLEVTLRLPKSRFCRPRPKSRYAFDLRKEHGLTKSASHIKVTLSLQLRSIGFMVKETLATSVSRRKHPASTDPSSFSYTLVPLYLGVMSYPTVTCVLSICRESCPDNSK